VSTASVSSVITVQGTNEYDWFDFMIPREPEPGTNWMVRTAKGDEDMFGLADRCVALWRDFLKPQTPVRSVHSSDDAQRPMVEAVERGECLDCGLRAHRSGREPEWLGLVPEPSLPPGFQGLGSTRRAWDQEVCGDLT